MSRTLYLHYPLYDQSRLHVCAAKQQVANRRRVIIVRRIKKLWFYTIYTTLRWTQLRSFARDHSAAICSSMSLHVGHYCACLFSYYLSWKYRPSKLLLRVQSCSVSRSYKYFAKIFVRISMRISANINDWHLSRYYIQIRIKYLCEWPYRELINSRIFHFLNICFCKLNFACNTFAEIHAITLQLYYYYYQNFY